MTNTPEAAILDLCSEDDYGSWELWWRVSADEPPAARGAAAERFVATVEELVGRGRIRTMRRLGRSGTLRPVPFDATELRAQLESASSPDPDAFYWFRYV